MVTPRWISSLTVFFGETPLKVAALREWSPPLKPGGGIEDVASRPLITVTVSRHGWSGFSTNGNSSTAPSLSIFQKSGAHPCGLKMPTKRGIFGVAAALAKG